ncbi:MAG: OmpA family protein [candidate division FCPU426 bacterium]
MKKTAWGAILLIFVVSLLQNGCATVGDGDKTAKGAGIGTVAGAAVGAAWGAARGDWKKGAMIGAATGLAIGGVTGVVMDKQEEDLRKAGIRTERDAAGNLVVNLSGETLKFDSGKATLKPEGEALLSKLSGVLAKYPENRIMIEGHTDSTGKASANLVLSQNRADRVKAFLLGKGVPARGILSSTGFGLDKPVADNKTVEGRAANRRVELKISMDKEEAEKNQAEREKRK